MQIFRRNTHAFARNLPALDIQRLARSNVGLTRSRSDMRIAMRCAISILITFAIIRSARKTKTHPLTKLNRNPSIPTKGFIVNSDQKQTRR